MLKKNSVLILGDILLDIFYLVDQYPDLGSDQIIKKEFSNIGGCATNVAVTLKNLNQTPYIISKLGKDEKALKIKEYLEEFALPQDCIEIDESHETGYSLCIIDKSGERTFLTYQGENNSVTKVIKEELVKEASFLYVTGYKFSNKKLEKALVPFLQDLLSHGVKMIFDPGPLVEKISRETLIFLLENSYIITPNEREYEKIIEMVGLPYGYPSFSSRFGISYMVMKRGKLGSIVWDGTDATDLLGYNVDVKDTTGAGDSFAGGLIFGLTQGLDLKKAVQIGQACGAITTTKFGSSGRFTVQDVEKLMNQKIGDVS